MEKEELCERLIQQPSAEQAVIRELRDRVSSAYPCDVSSSFTVRQSCAGQLNLLFLCVTTFSVVQHAASECNNDYKLQSWCIPFSKL